ncbi:hypothetical protein [Emticicia sp. 17c]|uniref:hypothetical protein n=1 Tax=Emticicia sp. 17c TaxID=3127704 RepID=UPI00301D5124
MKSISSKELPEPLIPATKRAWEAPDFTILNDTIIRGSGETGGDLSSQLES